MSLGAASTSSMNDLNARVIDLKGRSYGRLTVISMSEERTSCNKIQWLCHCSCGNDCLVASNALRRKKTPTRSCGCLKAEQCLINMGHHFLDRAHDQSGEKNSMWQGGITPKNKALRNTLEYKEWRFSVFKRDDFTCWNCGSRGGHLEAHHIIPFRESEEYRLIRDNGATLCVDCHNEFHTLYGIMKNTDDDFWEWIDE